MNNPCQSFPAIVVSVIAALALIGVSVARAATFDRFLGVTLDLSLVFSVAFSAYLFALADIEHRLFHHLVFGTAQLGENEGALRIVKIDALVKLFGTMVYAGANFGTIVGGVFVPIGPTPERITLVAVKNISIVLYFAQYYVSYVVILQKLRLIKGVSDNANFQKTLDSVARQHDTAKKQMVLMFISYGLFTCVPQLYAFNYFVATLLLGISCIKSNPLYSLSRGVSGDSSSQRQRASVVKVENTMNRQLSADTNETRN